MKDRRIARLQEQIKATIAEILQRELADPKIGMVTITRIELDREFTICKAWWSIFGDDKTRARTEGALSRARAYVQRALGATLHTRTVPRLEFHFDQSIAGAIRIQELLGELGKERVQRESERPAVPPVFEEPEADRPQS